MKPTEAVLAFWEAMATNDFEHAASLLSEEFEGLWPQSNEKISGRKNFSAINSAYPQNGSWNFVVNKLVSQGSEVVTDVSITDGVQSARAITFHTVENGEIKRQVEYWPDDYEAPEWRRQWITQISEDSA